MTVETPREALSVEERVQNGICFLDERVPGWRERIDLDTLDVTDAQNCIVCQLFGAFGDGIVTELCISSDQAERLGFCPMGPSSTDAVGVDAAWKSALRGEA